MSPAETLRMVGESLYGARWQSYLAADLKVADRTMRRWVAGSELPRVDVVSDLMLQVKARAVHLDEVAQALLKTPRDQWRATGPKVPHGEERKNEERPAYITADDCDVI